MIWKCIRSILFIFDAETVHHISIKLIQMTYRVLGAKILNKAFCVQPLETWTMGMAWRTPVGLAAGFDKNADLVEILPHLGFGFVEIGTVTPKPQPGNPRPRLWREPKTLSILNRMGFNSAGAEVVSQKLAKQKKHLPPEFRVGVNIGKNKDTPLDRAHEDYKNAIIPFQNLADYVVINVSSPNTPGLRSLQESEQLKPIVTSVLSVIQSWKPRPPLLLKLAPELQGDALEKIIRESQTWGIDGYVLTNTLAGEAGGWSGKKLAHYSLQSLINARRTTHLPIISVGGIFSRDDFEERIQNGAQLVQIYTGWIYQGPKLPTLLIKAKRP